MAELFKRMSCATILKIGLGLFSLLTEGKKRDIVQKQRLIVSYYLTWTET